MIKKIDKKNRFVSVFNPQTGFYVRSGVIEDGKDTGKDPFMASFPELLDVGIMQTCACSHKCNVDCYQKAIDRTGDNMSVKNFESILKQSQGKMFQCLYENEVVIIRNKFGYISSKYIKDVRVGDFVFDGQKFVKVLAKHEKEDNIYKINLNYGKYIYATKEHKFPTNNGLKQVKDLLPGDILLKTKRSADTFIQEVDIVKMIIANGLDNKYYLSNCDGMDKVCKENNIIRNSHKTVKISYIKNYLEQIDYSNAVISKERSNFRLNTYYSITSEFMTLLGHYVGNGSKRTYVVSNSQEKMIDSIKSSLEDVFPDFTYSIKDGNNTKIIELNSTTLHVDLFDKIFRCRCNNQEKQLPNFIFGISDEMKLSFLKGYFCDGNMRIVTKDGKYGNIIFNTSSNKLYKDLCVLLASLNIDYSIRTEDAKQTNFSKKDSRIINRRKRYRIIIENLREIAKIKDVVSEHKGFKKFETIVLSEHDDNCLKERKPYIVKDIVMKEKKRVIDINVDSIEHLFVTSHGIVSHNCALGGAGDVDTHESFEEILQLCRQYNIVPNFTTSGILMTKEKAAICKKYCGAVAISEHFTTYTENALDLLIKAGVKTNIHYVLSKKTIDTAISRLKDNSFKQGINAVVFLLYKPVGLGKEEYMLTANDEKVQEFFSLIDTGKFHHKIGFDSCSCSGIINYTEKINLDSIDFCEGARFSAYIDANMNMMPCSFANQDSSWFMNLNKYTIKEVWDSKLFDKFRYSLKNSCKNCKSRNICGGGCPIVNRITLCNKKERKFEEKKIYETTQRFCD